MVIIMTEEDNRASPITIDRNARQVLELAKQELREKGWSGPTFSDAIRHLGNCGLSDESKGEVL